MRDFMTCYAVYRSAVSRGSGDLFNIHLWMNDQEYMARIARMVGYF